MNFDELKNPELQEKLKSAKSPEDILSIAKEEGYELSDGQLEAISGDDAWYEPTCKTYRPKCPEAWHPDV